MKGRKLASVLIGVGLLGACSDSSDESTHAGGLGAGSGSVATLPVSGSGGAGGTGTAATSAAGGAAPVATPPTDAGEGDSAPVGDGADAGSATSVDSPSATRWVGTWSASPYPVSANDQPPVPLSNSVLRQVARVSLGGTQIRVQFSNRSGNGPVTIQTAHVALCTAALAVDSTIDVTTDEALTFAGTETVTIAQGQEVWSDPIDFALPPLGNVSITTAFQGVPGALTGHAGSRTTSYVQAGSGDVSAADMASAQTTDHWYYISGIDVMADATARAVVAIGDSLTDGRGTDTNGNNRWTDILAARLLANAETAAVAVLNQGIGATNLVGTTGTAAEARFSRDVLGQSGARYAIIHDGVNDIGGGTSFETMRGAYDRLISAAHEQGLLVYGATILPFGGNGFYNAATENVRQQVNAYIKSGVFDGFIDFDAALTDGGNPPSLQPPFATWAQSDGLHPGPAGYRRMGETPALALFAR